MKNEFIIKRNLAILTYAYAKQNLRAEVFVSSSLPCSLAKQFETILKSQHNQFITRHARFNWQWQGLIDTLQFYFYTVESPVSDHQKGAALVVGIFIWEVVYKDAKVGQQGGTLPGISPDKSTFCKRIHWDATAK